ncbi:MAG: hypothetical protein AABZ39_08895 [Spirochaetota bacterium]
MRARTGSFILIIACVTSTVFAVATTAPASGTIVRSDASSYAWSREQGGYYEIKGIRTIVREYNERNETVRSTDYVKNDKVYRVMKFADAGRAKQVFDGAGKLLYSTAYEGPEKRVETVFGANGDKLWYYGYRYNERGVLTERRRFAADKSLLFIQKYHYDKSGLPVGIVLSADDGSVLHVAEYSYDAYNDNGGWSSRRETQSYADKPGEPKERIERSTFYSKDVPRSSMATADHGSDFSPPPVSVDALLALTARYGKEDSPGGKVLAAAHALIAANTIIRGSCWDWINLAYKNAGFTEKNRKSVFSGKESGPYANPYDLKPGDWIMFKNLTYGEIGHSGIFLFWIDAERRSAMVIGYVGEGRARAGDFREHDITYLFGITRGK